MEILSVEPRIEIHHGALSDSEVKELLEVASSYTFGHAAELDAEDGTDGEGSYRVADDISLDDDEEPFAKVINRRMAVMTGLNIDHGEELQIMKYR